MAAHFKSERPPLGYLMYFVCYGRLLLLPTEEYGKDNDETDPADVPVLVTVTGL
jgi:hypothetical protein